MLVSTQWITGSVSLSRLSFLSNEKDPTVAAVAPGEAPGTQHSKVAAEHCLLHDPDEEPNALSAVETEGPSVKTNTPSVVKLADR